MYSDLLNSTHRPVIMYAFIGSCKINGINPEQWLEDILLRIVDTQLSDIASLLPNAWKQPE